jgi:signal transduction histidine kinase/CheY-like chemotaxis protein
MDSDGVSGILGFDALGRCHITQCGELGLFLRMGFHAIADAVERDSLEREKAYLETRLQHARRMETVGALASGIAHNFNNIIGAILGHTEMAETELPSDSRPVRNLNAIRRAGERARDLVYQILAFGRRREVRPKPISLHDLVAEAESLLQASLPSGIELAINEVSEAVLVNGDHAQLLQVILNLCNNAAQAMDGTGCIEVEAEVRDIARPRRLSHGDLAPGRYARIAVSDGGHGIDDATLGRIFEPFFTTRLAGNGLGLATVREIVREHGGAINVWSKQGTGSRFEAWLPVVAAPSASSEDPRALPLGSGETLLVVEDEREQLLRDEEVLAALGYEPLGFTRPGDALAACRTALERFDALVVGYCSPTSALELATALHEIAPRLPALLATASADEIKTDALIAAGISEVVCWPFDCAEIAAALKRCLAPSEDRLRLPIGVGSRA